VLAGAGWVWLVRSVRAKFGATTATVLAIVIAAASLPAVLADVHDLDYNYDQIVAEADLYGTVPEAIKAGGGEARLKSCGAVYTGAFQTQAVAWYMHLHEMQSEIFAYPPGTTIAPDFSPLSHDPRFPPIGRTRKWVVGSSCQR